MKLLHLVNHVRKFLVALGAALGILAACMADGHVTGEEWLQVGIAFLGAYGVWQVRNARKDGLQL